MRTMTAVPGPIDQTPEWQALAAHATAMRTASLRELFASEPDRGERLTFEVDGLYVDYSKSLVTADTIRRLLELAARAALPERIEAMFTGERINVTEDRPVLHVALRAPEAERIEVDGVDVVAEVHRVL